MPHCMRSPILRVMPVACLLLAFLLAGCGVMTTTPGLGPYPQMSLTPVPTFTAAPARSLSWQARSLPALTADPTLLGISSSNTGTAWFCAPNGSGAQVWVTRDGAQHWQRVSDVTANGPVDVCSVVADQVDPQTAVVQMARRPSGCCALPNIPYPMMATRDGGKSWAQVHGPYSEMSSLASYHGVSYAIFHGPFGDASIGIFAFATSSDGLRTWRRADSALATQGGDPVDARAVRDVWVNPATGEILVHTQTSAIWTDRFLVSDDGGKTWRDLHAPQADQFVVRVPYAAGPWEICGLRTSMSSMKPTWPAPLICTLDNGASWKDRDSVGAQDNSAFALANDGYALAGDNTGVYRSSPGSGRWELLGQPPTSDALSYVYQSGAGAGSIWALPQNSGGYSAPLMTQIYVASYA